MQEFPGLPLQQLLAQELVLRLILLVLLALPLAPLLLHLLLVQELVLMPLQHLAALEFAQEEEGFVPAGLAFVQLYSAAQVELR